MIQELFFELIRVAIGTQDTLSRPPSADEWKQLYDMAKKQSLVGVCFAGVQRILSNSPLKDKNPSVIGIPEMLYLTWMGMAAKIQQRNEVVNQQCVDLQKQLSADGFRSAILKGQGVASLYGEHLLGLRQSGDIDVYVPGGMKKAMDYATRIEGRVEYDYINAHLHVSDSSTRSGQVTEVELHWRLQVLENLWMNRKLQRWTDEHVDEILGGSCMLSNGETLTVPSAEVNCFYILVHAYHHMMSEGLGLRQLMDYYFVLHNVQTKGFSVSKVQEFHILINGFGIIRFAKGVMWILHEVFGIERECMICEPDEREGRFLLKEVMTGGNFGHHDERTKKIGKGKMVSVMNEVQHAFRIGRHYPSMIFWRPVWIVWHYVWKHTSGRYNFENQQ